jgi:hypothetical protein
MRSQLWGSLAVALGIAATTGPLPASAATPVGELFPAENLCGPMVPGPPSPTFLQTTSPANRYAAPSAGVITAWSHQAGTNPPELRLKVARPTGGNMYTIIGESQLETPAPDVVTTFGGLRIPVQAGDVIGFAVRVNGECGRSGAPASDYGTSNNGDDVPLGTNAPFSPSPLFQLSLSATLEPDADNDGFGDETQDNCVGTAGSFNGCPNELALGKPKGKGGRVRLAATVPGAGTLSAGSASDPALATAARSKRPVKHVTMTLTSTTKQKITLALKLTEAAKSKLAEKGRLRIRVKAVYTPIGGPPGSERAKATLKA